MTYIIKTGQAMVCYYYFGGRLLKRVRSAKGLSEEFLVMSGVRPAFSLNLTKKGVVCIFCRDMKGNVVFLRDEKSGVKSRVILESKENVFKGNILFDAVFGENGIDLVFNAPARGGEENIYAQRLWDKETAPILLDGARPVTGEAFRAAQSVGGLRLLFYHKNGAAARLGYRELLGARVGSFNTVFESGQPFGEYSMMISRERFYFLAVITGFFYSRLIYKTKGGEGFSSLKTIAEMKGIEKPLVFLFDGRPAVFFKSGGRAYICFEDLKPKPFKGKICESLSRGIFIDRHKGSRIKASEALVNEEKPWDVRIYSELDENFLSFSPEPPTPPTPPRRDYSFKDFFDKKGSELL